MADVVVERAGLSVRASRGRRARPDIRPGNAHDDRPVVYALIAVFSLALAGALTGFALSDNAEPASVSAMTVIAGLWAVAFAVVGIRAGAAAIARMLRG